MRAEWAAVAIHVQVRERRRGDATQIDRRLGSAVEGGIVDVVHRSVAAVGIGEVHVRQGEVSRRGEKSALNRVLNRPTASGRRARSRHGEATAVARGVQHDAAGASIGGNALERQAAGADCRVRDVQRRPARRRRGADCVRARDRQRGAAARSIGRRKRRVRAGQCHAARKRERARGVVVQENAQAGVGDRAIERHGAARATLNVDHSTGVAADGRRRIERQRNVALRHNHFGAGRVGEIRGSHVDRAGACRRDVQEGERVRAARDIHVIDDGRQRHRRP